MERVKFGDVVKEVKVNIDRNNNPYEYFVAGDHMDSEILEIQRKGRFVESDVGPAFIRLFRPGQVLYGSRRTYLKKIAVADFSGITSNTTFVLETKNESLMLQKLLPFLMLTDDFTEFSIKHSKGSTNPYILFSDLARYEFELPTIDEQKRLADIFWAANDTKIAYRRLHNLIEDFTRAYFIEMFGDLHREPRYSLIELGSISDMLSGGTPSRSHPEYFGGEMPFVSTPSLGQNYIDASVAQNWLTEQGILNSATNRIPAFSLMFGNRVGVGKSSINICEMCTNQDIISFVNIDSNKFELLYIKKVLDQFQSFFEAQKRGATIKGVPSELVKATKIPQAPIAAQRQYVDFVRKADKSKANLQLSLEMLEDFMRQFTNRVFNQMYEKPQLHS